MEKEAGIRELKTHLSAYLRRVKAGETIIITERGTPVGRIVLIGASLENQMEALVHAGLVSWNGKKLRRITPVARAKDAKTVAELLIEDRE